MMFGLIIIIFVAYYMFSSSNPRGSGSRCGHQSHEHTPLDILNERYARGEIQSEEYLERKQELLR